MNHLVSNGIVEQYRPLTDIKGSYSAQFEHVSMIGSITSFRCGALTSAPDFPPP